MTDRTQKCKSYFHCLTYAYINPRGGDALRLGR